MWFVARHSRQSQSKWVRQFHLAPSGFWPTVHVHDCTPVRSFPLHTKWHIHVRVLQGLYTLLNGHLIIDFHITVLYINLTYLLLHIFISKFLNISQCLLKNITEYFLKRKQWIAVYTSKGLKGIVWKLHSNVIVINFLEYRCLKWYYD